MATEKLYNVKGTEEYGVYLTKDSSGKYVLEMKGGAGVKAFDKAALEEVLPYTVSLRFINDTADRKYDYFAVVGSVKVGDLLYVDGTSGLAEVTALDTKSRAATKTLTGWILSGTKLTGE